MEINEIQRRDTEISEGCMGRIVDERTGERVNDWLNRLVYEWREGR